MTPLFASISSTFVDAVARDGVPAVALLMAADALLPAAGGIVMLAAGALAAGVFPGHDPSLFGLHLGTGLGAYLVLASAGTIGYLAGALLGWMIGRFGGRPFVDRWGRLLHLGPANMATAEEWFALRGEWAVFIGRLIPVVRSFISIPAGVLNSSLETYIPLTLLGSAVWSFIVAAVGWALGSSYASASSGVRAIELVVVVVVGLGGGALLLQRSARRSSRGAR